MKWLLFALVCMLGWGFADLFYKKGSSDPEDRLSHLKIAVWVGIVLGVSAFVLMPFAESGTSPRTLFVNALRYSPASIGYIVSMIIGYAGLRYLELSIVSPVQNASGALSAIIMSVWFVLFSDNAISSISDETGFSFGKVSGSALFNNIIIVFGIISVVVGVISLAIVEKRLDNDQITQNNNKKYTKGALALIFPLLYCLFDTLGTAADGIILNEETGLSLGEIDVLVLYGLTFFAAGLCAWIFIFIKTGRPYNPFARSELARGTAAVCETFGQVFYVYAMAEKPVLAAPVVASYCIVSVLLSRVFMKEKLTKSQYACVFAVILGIVLLGISEGLGA